MFKSSGPFDRVGLNGVFSLSVIPRGYRADARLQRRLVFPFCGLYLESYKVIPKRNYLGACGQGCFK